MKFPSAPEHPRTPPRPLDANVRVAFASPREFDYLLRDERGDGVASIDELERA